MLELSSSPGADAKSETRPESLWLLGFRVLGFRDLGV